MTPTGTIWPLADRAVKGRLRAIIREHQTEALSAEASARRLATKHKLDISSTTVQTWRRQIAIEDGDAGPVTA